MALRFKKRKNTDAIVVHCSASENKPSIDRATIAQWHKTRGFMDIGYHYVIKTDGVIEVGREKDAVGAHVQGHNATTIGICLVGGVNSKGVSEYNFTPEQMYSLRKLITELKLDYPEAEVKGHRDFPNVHKDCPCFDAGKWFAKGEQTGIKHIVVTKGDTLWGIATKFNTTVEDIIELNKLLNDKIKIGEILKVPVNFKVD